MSGIQQERLPNGLWLLAEEIPAAQSLAMTLLVPAGTAQEPADQQGVGAMLAEMMCRGAGDLDARQHSDALDHLGVQRGTNVGTRRLSLGATMIGEKLGQALPLLLDMVRRPRLSADALEPTRDLCLQAIDSLDDEPQHRVMLELWRQHDPAPLNRSPLGQRDALERIKLEQVRAFQQDCFVPSGSVLAFAGKLNWPALRDHVMELLGDWTGTRSEPSVAAAPERTDHHVMAQTSQVHIALAYDAVPEPDSDSILQRAAAAVLSGGMSGRLFTEVREKRGLCYAVHASYAGRKDRGAMMGYAGTTTPRAAQTLEVMEAELRKLSDGVTENEFHRAIVGMKARLVMQGESTGARAASIANDQVVLGRPRSLDEMAAQVDAVTLDRLNQFLDTHRPGEMTMVTIGPTALRTEVEIED